MLRNIPRITSMIKTSRDFCNGISSAIKIRHYSSRDPLQFFVTKEDHGDEIIQFMERYFFPRDPVNIATEITDFTDRPFLRSLYIPSGVSVGAREPVSKQLVGVHLALIETRDQTWKIPTSSSHAGMRRWLASVQYMRNTSNVFSDPKIQKAVYNGFISVHPKYGGRGIARSLTKMTERLGQAEGCQVVCANSMNPNAQALLRSLGYKVTNSIRCHDLYIEGVKIFNNDLLADDSVLSFFVKYL